MFQTLKSLLKVFTILLIAVFYSLAQQTSIATAGDESAKSVAILPFAMHAPSSMSYLQEGLRDMLASRLAANGGAAIIEQTKVDALQIDPGQDLQQGKAAEMAQQLAADYIISGSLTSLGGSVSLDAKVFAADETVPPLNFYASAGEEKEVIGAVNQLSWYIAEQVFGAKPPAAAAGVRAPQPVQAPEDEAMAAFKTEHPDKVYKTQTQVRTPGSGSALIRPQSVAAMQGFSKTQNLDISLQAMDAGDIDGDGSYDVVMADKQNVYIHHLVNNRLAEFAVIEMPARSKIHNVSIADLDGNGKAELYISAADDYKPYSWAYQWNGTGMEPILNDIPWYIRVVSIPGEGPTLVGQRGGQTSLLLAGIFRLMRTGTTVQPEQRLVMPDYVNLFDFALADINQDGITEVIGINTSDRMYVVRPDGSVLWVSDDYYGGTSRYIGEEYDLVGRTGLDVNSEHSSTVIGMEGSGKRLYIPSRMVVMDVNDDGRDDIIVNRNLAAFSRHIENYKKFKSGEIYAMSWNGIAMSEIWQTKKIDGYIPDFAFLPLPGQENRARLFVGLELATGWTSSFTGGESTLLLYDVELAEKNENQAEPEN